VTANAGCGAVDGVLRITPCKGQTKLRQPLHAKDIHW
jgi:hypothetical protein